MTKSSEQLKKDAQQQEWEKQQYNIAEQFRIKKELAALQLDPSAQTKQPVLETDKPEAMEEYCIEGEDLGLVVALYNEKYNKKPDGTPNPDYRKPTKNEDGSVSLYFTSEQEFINFSIDAADKKMAFIMTDSSNMVLCYSNGDGQLYHADGNEYKKGDLMKQSNISLEEFMSTHRETCSP